MTTAQEKAVEFGLPFTFSPAPEETISVDADEAKGLIVITITKGGWAPTFIALDSLDAAHVGNAIHAARRLLAGTSFDMHRRETDLGGPGTH